MESNEWLQKIRDRRLDDAYALGAGSELYAVGEDGRRPDPPRQPIITEEGLAEMHAEWRANIARYGVDGYHQRLKKMLGEG